MIIATGKYNLAKIYSDRYDETAYGQIIELCNQKVFMDSKIRVMPDYHAGRSCVIGFTSTFTDFIVPNIVGVDIGCGVLATNLGHININLEKLDDFIKNNIPVGFEVNDKENPEATALMQMLYCGSSLDNKSHLAKSLGSLGGGNHFIEVDVDNNNNKWLVIHTGSRNLGKQVCNIYQGYAKSCTNSYYSTQEKMVIDTTPKECREMSLRVWREENKYKSGLEFLTYPEPLNLYLADMGICQSFAACNRWEILNKILMYLGNVEPEDGFDTIHNYVDIENKIIRKGAVSAQKGETLIIPMNMRDGSLICKGKGNSEWNYSAPHGAGRLMSRSEAKQAVDIETYERSMHGIYSSCVNQSTIDESPMVYKPMEEIVEQIQDTVEILGRIKPIYNFKAGEHIGKHGKN